MGSHNKTKTKQDFGETVQFITGAKPFATKGRPFRRPAGSAKKNTPRTHKPSEMSLEEWQIALRREFGPEQNFRLKNIGSERIFSEFLVTNPNTNRTYRVAIRGERPGDNFCSCPDFAVNTLGTCKHIEFTLVKLKRTRGARTAFAGGFHPAYSEVYLRYGLKREVIFAPGIGCPQRVLDLTARYFDENGILRPQAYSQFDAFLREAGQDGHELRCYEDAIGFVAQVRDEVKRRELIDEAFSQDADGRAFEKLLKAPLYPYQRKGALFAARAGRCLIADCSFRPTPVAWD